MKRIATTACFLLFLIVIMPLPILAQSGPVQYWTDIPKDSLVNDNIARIIVIFDVPNLDALTKASTAASMIPADPWTKRATRESIAVADAALNAAIGSEADRVLRSLKSDRRTAEESYSLNRRYDYLPMLALNVSSEALNALLADPSVIAIYPDRLKPLPIVENSGLNTDIPGPAITKTRKAASRMVEGNDLVGAVKAWDQGYTGQGWHVAILDTGIRSSHELFQGKEIIEACFSQSMDCPNEQKSMIGTGAAAHLSETIDGFDHGTHVAGIAAGSKPDQTLFGVAKDADIIAVNVFSILPPGACGPDEPRVSSSSSDITAGLLYIYSLRGLYNIGAVNMSLGGDRFYQFCDNFEYPITMAMQLLAEVNIPTVIATGNEGFCGGIGAPACISSAISVMASNKRDMEAKFNNWDVELGDIFAPGQDILSATGESDNSYEEWDGTSMAAPYVAGAMTLMRQARPQASPSELLARLKERGPSITTSCSDAGNVPRLYVDNFGPSSFEKAEILFEGLEEQYGDLLKPLPTPTQVDNGTFFRHYTFYNVYLATHQNIAYYVDQDGDFHELGLVDDLLK